MVIPNRILHTLRRNSRCQSIDPLSSSALLTPPSLDLVHLLRLPPLVTSSSTKSYLLLCFLGATRPLPLPPLNCSARPLSHRTWARSLYRMWQQSGRTTRAPGCRTDSTNLTAYQSPMGWHWMMEAPAAVEASLGMESARWWNGRGLWHQRSLGSAPWTYGDA
jgi:hypothetical protein